MLEATLTFLPSLVYRNPYVAPPGAHHLQPTGDAVPETSSQESGLRRTSHFPIEKEG